MGRPTHHPVEDRVSRLCTTILSHLARAGNQPQQIPEASRKALRTTFASLRLGERPPSTHRGASTPKCECPNSPAPTRSGWQCDGTRVKKPHATAQRPKALGVFLASLRLGENANVSPPRPDHPSIPHIRRSPPCPGVPVPSAPGTFSPRQMRPQSLPSPTPPWYPIGRAENQDSGQRAKKKGWVTS
jgi:hypothetical protein